MWYSQVWKVSNLVKLCGKKRCRDNVAWCLKAVVHKGAFKETWLLLFSPHGSKLLPVTRALLILSTQKHQLPVFYRVTQETKKIHVGRLLESILCWLINCISAEPPPTFSTVTVRKRHSNPAVFAKAGPTLKHYGGKCVCFHSKNYWTQISTHNKLSSVWRAMTAIKSHFTAVAILLFSSSECRW